METQIVLEFNRDMTDKYVSFANPATNLMYTFTDTILEPTADNVDLLLEALENPVKYKLLVDKLSEPPVTLEKLLELQSNKSTAYGGQIFSQLVFMLYSHCPFSIIESPSDPNFFYMSNYTLPHSTPLNHYRNCNEYDAGKVVRVGLQLDDKFIVFEDGYACIDSLKTTMSKTTICISYSNNSSLLPLPGGKYKAGIKLASLENTNLYIEPPTDGIHINPMTFSCSGILRAMDNNAIDKFVSQISRVCAFFGSRLKDTPHQVGLLGLYKFLDYNDPSY